MRIRRVHSSALAAALLFLGTGTSATRPVRADDGKIDGTWKLLVLAFGDDEFALVKLSPQDGKIAGTVVDAQQMLLGRPQVKRLEQTGNLVTLTLSGPTGETTFAGTIIQEGPSAGKILGSYTFRGELYPARLEKSTDTKVGNLNRQSSLVSSFQTAMRERDPKSKVKKLEELIQGNHGAPNNQLLYSALLDAAEAAGLDAQKVENLIKQWSEEARPYGEGWVNEVRLKALKVIGANKNFAKLGVALAQEVDKAVNDQAVEKKAAVVEILAKAARLSGMADLAEEADARRAKLELRLDEEYHHKVPPFHPTAYAGRKKAEGNQVVLMELFTGAECPPCVAADVAFDALLQTYKPADFIGLQYHLHIPGPDPLTNRDSLARQRYYGSEVRGTPSTFFNGKSEAGGGGGMGNSEGKYTEYREIIDKALESSKGARIELSANRAGDQIKIVASAEMTPKGDGPKGEDAQGKPTGSSAAKSRGATEKSKQILRLALTEESVRYTGGNKLRFHHHVVRALPGGANGKELAGGAGKIEVTIDLAEWKRGQESYLSDFAKSTSFPKPLPEIKLDDLAVVAFVQDDGDKRILDAVSVPVKKANP
jgi:hypothetical protein